MCPASTPCQDPSSSSILFDLKLGVLRGFLKLNSDLLDSDRRDGGPANSVGRSTERCTPE